jgi:hypothetical protein
MWAGAWTDVHDESNGSFLHPFHESAQIRENVKDMSSETDTYGRIAFDYDVWYYQSVRVSLTATPC